MLYTHGQKPIDRPMCFWKFFLVLGVVFIFIFFIFFFPKKKKVFKKERKDKKKKQNYLRKIGEEGVCVCARVSKLVVCDIKFYDGS